jgi:predicted HTH transcriptional regulator
LAKNPRDQYPQAVLKAKVKYGNSKPSSIDFNQPLVMVPYEVEAWLNKVLHSKVERSSFQRKTKTDFPIEPLREAIINALLTGIMIKQMPGRILKLMMIKL